MNKRTILCFVSLFSTPTLCLAQQCSIDTIVETTPTTQFVIHGDGTVTDTSTALMWKQCMEGLSGVDCSNGNITKGTWAVALQTPRDTNTTGGFAGYADWRLPNQAELASLLEERCVEPSINADVFPNTADSFLWSASADYNNDAATWFVDFKHGATGTILRETALPIRLVRSVQ